jgi:hypothetical protein
MRLGVGNLTAAWIEALPAASTSAQHCQSGIWRGDRGSAVYVSNEPLDRPAQLSLQ